MDQASQLDHSIREITKEVQTSVDEKRKNTREEDEALQQLGLENGTEIIEEYLEHNERGCALEHLIYMVKETGVVMSPEAKHQLLNICNLCEIPF